MTLYAFDESITDLARWRPWGRVAAWPGGFVGPDLPEPPIGIQAKRKKSGIKFCRGLGWGLGSRRWRTRPDPLPEPSNPPTPLAAAPSTSMTTRSSAIAGRPRDAKARQRLLKWTWKWQPRQKWPSNVLQGHQMWQQSKAIVWFPISTL